MESKYIVRERVDDISLEDENVINLIMIPQAGLGRGVITEKMEPTDHVLVERKYAEESQIDTDRDERTKQSVQRDGFGKHKRGGGRDDEGVKAAKFSKELSKQKYVLFGFSLGDMDCV